METLFIFGYRIAHYFLEIEEEVYGDVPLAAGFPLLALSGNKNVENVELEKLHLFIMNFP